MRIHIRVKKDPVIFVLVLFLFGIICGVLMEKLLLPKTNIRDTDNIIQYLQQVNYQRDTFVQKSFYICSERIRELILFFLFLSTWFGIPYAFLFLIKKGFVFGILLCRLADVFGKKGILLLASFYFPGCLCTIPILVFCYSIVYRMLRHRKEYKEESLHKKNMLQLSGKTVILIVAGCILSSLLDCTVGVKLIRYLLSVFLAE